MALRKDCLNVEIGTKDCLNVEIGTKDLLVSSELPSSWTGNSYGQQRKTAAVASVDENLPSKLKESKLLCSQVGEHNQIEAMIQQPKNSRNLKVPTKPEQITMESLLPNRCAARQPSRNSEKEAVSELKAVASPQRWAHEVSCAKEGKWKDSQSLNPCAIPQLCNACVTHTF
ncbi:unnamed protein product, partial [Protopolystoma xenopodis]